MQQRLFPQAAGYSRPFPVTDGSAERNCAGRTSGSPGHLAARPQNANTRPSWGSDGKHGQESPGAGNKGETSWRGKPGTIRLTAATSRPAGADFWAVQV